MRRLGLVLVLLAAAPSAWVVRESDRVEALPARAAASSPAAIQLKEAKLVIEHNATDEDTGLQGFVDAEGWRRLELRGPRGPLLRLEARGELARLGMTELFFESVEPENESVPIERLLARFPAGRYTFTAPAHENGERVSRPVGVARLTHEIPAGPTLVSPSEGATVPTSGVVARWKPVSKSITGRPVTIVAYQLVVEKDVEPRRHMIGNLGLSMYLPPTVTSVLLPDGLLAPGAAYTWEVLAIERSGNQTLSSGSFRTRR